MKLKKFDKKIKNLFKTYLFGNTNKNFNLK